MGIMDNGFNYKNLAANATTLVRTGPGILHAVAINTKGGSSNVCTIYDGLSASGTKIAALDTTANVGYVQYDVTFETGLTVVIGTGTAGDLTISWAPTSG